MNRLDRPPDDFEAQIRILTEREGGRPNPPFNGIRWDIRYFEEDEGASAVWPEFVDDRGVTNPQDRPITGFVKARMYIIHEKMRDFHRERARPGVGFFCVEGSRVYAAGIIARITGLERDPTRLPQNPDDKV